MLGVHGLHLHWRSEPATLCTGKVTGVKRGEAKASPHGASSRVDPISMIEAAVFLWGRLLSLTCPSSPSSHERPSGTWLTASAGRRSDLHMCHCFAQPQDLKDHMRQCGEAEVQEGPSLKNRVPGASL